MKRTLLLLTSAVVLAGCQSPRQQTGEWTNNDRAATNAWLMRTYFDDQVTNGIVTQHTIYPHHFVDGTAKLTERGRRDLAVLAGYFAENEGGVLIMPHGRTPQELYEQRVEAVRVALAGGGVEPSLVTIDDGVWDGETVRSTRAGEDFSRPSDPDPYNFHSSNSQK